MTLNELLHRIHATTGQVPSASGTRYAAHCPAHRDSNPSLSISEGEGGRLLLHCHAGCSFESICAALQVSAAELAGSANVVKRGRPQKFTIAATYDYCDADGAPLFQVCGMEPKAFRQRRPDATALDGFTWNLKGVRQVPFRLPELTAALRDGDTVFIAEGEKDVEALRANGFAATCNAGGANKWRTEFGEYFDGAKCVVVIADKDAPGREHAADVAEKLKPLVRCVKLIELPDVEARPVKDAADFFVAGGTAELLRELTAAAAEYVPIAELTPGNWFKLKYPKLTERYGEPLHEVVSGKRAQVRDAGEDFIAATLGADGTPDAPTVYLSGEDRFYTYNKDTGIYERQREEDISARISDLYLTCARDCRETADVSKLMFAMRDSAALTGVVKRAKALLRVPDDYFAQRSSEFLPAANGMLRLSDRTLLPFSPHYCCRHKLAVKYDKDAYCPRFMEQLLASALERSDIFLIQRWSGLALVGVNHSQKMLLLTGTPGGGKSTLVSVLTGIIGAENVGMLRTDFLGDRFELGRLLGKTLLYGADVAENFLTTHTASHLKSLTGGDPMTVEFKNSNESPQIKCQFNVIVTSNSRLTVYLEGDSDAWRRRLVIINYERPKPENPIPDFSARIIAEEGTGVLNFMLDGLDALRAANWKLEMNERQQRRVDDLLLESDAHRVFANECLTKDTNAPGMTKSKVYEEFVSFCDRRGWVAMSKNKFGKLGAEAITQTFGLIQRGDIISEDGKQNDGWKHLRLKIEKERGI
jgi:putative DNA primase/helicase